MSELDIQEHVDFVTKSAKHDIESGEETMPTVFAVQAVEGDKPAITVYALTFEDQRQKAIMYAAVRQMLHDSQPDLVLTVNEVWGAEGVVADELGQVIPPSEREDVKEGLMVQWWADHGRDAHCVIHPFSRSLLGKIIWEEGEEADQVVDHMFRFTW